VLHFAPEQELQDYLRERPGLAHRSVDLDSPLADDQADIQALPYADDSFDVVICLHVLEHIPDDALAMRELHRVLKPGGVLYIAVPNFGSIEAKLKRARWDLVHPVSHVRYFDRASLANLGERCGFEVLRPGYVRRDASALVNAACAAKTFVERNFAYYPLGLALYLRKR
jgi:SAM-dependent methyltransferase